MALATSTGKPTARQEKRIIACKEGVCIACYVWQSNPLAPEAFQPVYGCDYHHLKSGNIRRGHDFGFGGCGWHHRKIPADGMTTKQTRDWFGPSLLDGGKIFAATYGTDDELLEIANGILRETAPDVLP